jgi:hypothetical protein
MPRTTDISDDDWDTITLRTTDTVANIADPTAYVRDMSDLIRSIANTPEHHDPEVTAVRQQLQTAQDALRDTQAALNHSETQLAETQTTLRDATARLLAAPVALAGPAGPRPATVPLPDLFEGDMKTYRDFKTKLQNKFRADAPTFRNEQHRMAVAFGLLGSGAADIMRQYLREDRIDLATMDEFWVVLDQAFDDPDRKGTANRALRALKQGKRDFAQYLADFMRLKADVDWNDEVAIENLRLGCSQEIRNVLLNRIEPLPGGDNAFQDTAALFNRIDLHVRQWSAENAGQRNNATGQQQQPPKKVTPPVIPLSQRTTTNPAWTGPAPMDISASGRAAQRRVQQAARRSRAQAEGLCFTCLDPNHSKANCPAQARYDQERALRAAATAPAPPEEQGGAVAEPAEN